MTVDQFMGEMNQACQGLAGDANVVFKCIAAKNAGEPFATINSIAKVGDVVRVYPDPNSTEPAHVVVEFA